MSSVVKLLREEQQDLFISASALRALETCPRLWWYRYAAGHAPEDVPARLVLGGALHKALALFYSVLRELGEEPHVDHLVETAQNAITQALTSGPPVLFAEGDNEDTLRAEAVRLINAFLEHGFRPELIVGVEVPFCLPLHDPNTGELSPFEERVVGAMDLVVEDADGALAVLDHKIVGRVDPQRVRRPDVQMSLYAMAAAELYDVQEVKLRYQNVVRTKTAQVVLQDVARSGHDVAEGVEAVASGLALIHVAVSHPRGKQVMGRRRTWMCKDCSYRRRCAGDRS